MVRQEGDSAATALATALEMLDDGAALAEMAEAAGRQAGTGSKGVLALIEEVMGVADRPTDDG
jgi:hypothetical protein